MNSNDRETKGLTTSLETPRLTPEMKSKTSKNVMPKQLRGTTEGCGSSKLVSYPVRQQEDNAIAGVAPIKIELAE